MLLQKMSDNNASNAPWALLPAELLEKIFDSVPWFMLGNIGTVCAHWRDVVHRLAVKHLTNRIQNHLIEEKQLERWGWCSATAWDHNILACSCIHLDFNFFTSRREKTFSGRGFSKLAMDYERKIFPVGVMVDKLFFATADKEKQQVSLKVVNRLEPDCQAKIIKIIVVQFEDDNVQMVCCENLLVVLFFETGQVSLWDGKNETWLADLDISLGIPNNDHFYSHEVTLNKDLLALYLYGSHLRNRVLFFRLNTSQTAATPPQLIGVVEINFQMLVVVHMNEKWVAC
jgi:hypothetical protein